MAHVWMFLAANMASLACVIGAIFLLYRGVENGWGWLLVVAVLLHASWSSDK